MMSVANVHPHEGGNMKHSTDVPSADSLEELGVKVAQLRFDAMILFFRGVRKELSRQQKADEKRRHFWLALFGRSLVSSVDAIDDLLDLMLRQSIPHMKRELKAEPLLLEPRKASDDVAT